MNSEHEQDSQSSRQDGPDRLAAATRNMTLEPITDGVKPLEHTDEYIANQDVINGPIANISIDSEQTVADKSQLVELSTREHHHTMGFVIGGLLALALAGIFVFFFFVK